MTRKTTPGPNSDGSTGPSEQGGPVFVALGYLRRTHGIHGEMIMDILTDFPERVRANRPVYLGEEHAPHRLGSVRMANKFMLVSVKGYTTPEMAAGFRNTYVYVRADALPVLPEDAYYYHELIGIAVLDESGAALGELVEIIETGANDVYVVRNEAGTEQLFPAIADVVLKVDLESQEMIVRPQAWE
jgi:16S rRNA processing protein RimM